MEIRKVVVELKINSTSEVANIVARRMSKSISPSQIISDTMGEDFPCEIKFKVWVD